MANVRAVTRAILSPSPSDSCGSRARAIWLELV